MSIFMIYAFSVVGIITTAFGIVYAVNSLISSLLIRMENKKIEEEYKKNGIWLGKWGA